MLSLCCFFFLQPVLGHGSQDAQPFKQTKDGELFFTEDGEINLADLVEEKRPPVNMGQPSVRGNAYGTDILTILGGATRRDNDRFR